MVKIPKNYKFIEIPRPVLEKRRKKKNYKKEKEALARRGSCDESGYEVVAETAPLADLLRCTRDR